MMAGMTKQESRQAALVVGLVLLSLYLLFGAHLSAGTLSQDFPGEILTSRETPRVVSEKTLRRADLRAPIATEIRLPALSRAEKSLMSAPKPGTPLQIGVHRDLPVEWTHKINPAELAWEPRPDGSFVATLSVSSPGARAIRIASTFHSLPPGAQVRYFAPDAPDKPLGPYLRDQIMADEGDGSRLFWSPVVAGETLAFEIFAPSAEATSEIWFSLEAVSHVIRSPFERNFNKDLGDSGRCNKDLACTEAWEITGNSVVVILFEVDEAGFLCSGQLINHGNANRDLYYVLTARHCIGRKRVAKTATFLWFFQRAQCKGSLAAEMTQTAGGARLRFKTPKLGRKNSTDHSLLQLSQPPPAGVTQTGWSTRDPGLVLNEKVRGIHHPSGDVKKLSKGKVLYVFQLDTFDIREPFTHFWVEWKRGVTEPGSSGSGLWIGTEWPDQFLVGVLSAGLSSCEFREDPDWYGLFSETYRRYEKFRRLIDPATN